MSPRILFFCLAMMCAGCCVESIAPLGDPEKALPDERVHGKWSAAALKISITFEKCEPKLIESGAKEFRETHRDLGRKTTRDDVRVLRQGRQS